MSTKATDRAASSFDTALPMELKNEPFQQLVEQASDAVMLQLAATFAAACSRAAGSV